MSRKWFGIAFVGAIGAGMVANFAYQNAVMGQVSVEAAGEGPQEGTEGQEGEATEIITEQISPNPAQPGTQLRRTIEVVNGSRYGNSGDDVAVIGGFPGTANVYRFRSPENSEIQASDLTVARLLKEFQDAEEDARGKIVEKIAAEVEKQFDLRQAAREKELKELEEQLAKLKEKHTKRESMKDDIVKDRVNQLIDNVEGLGWGTDPVPFGVNQFPGQAMGSVPGWISPTASVPFGVAVPPMPAMPAALAPASPTLPAAPPVDTTNADKPTATTKRSGSRNGR